jgi:hypothetical protein
MGDLSGREGSGGMWVPVEITTPTCLQNHGAVEQWRIVTQPDLHPKPHTKKRMIEPIHGNVNMIILHITT